MLNYFSGAPDKQRADRILPHNGIEQTLNLIFAPDKWALNVWQPKAAVRFAIVE
jgi:hypothetical protein